MNATTEGSYNEKENQSNLGNDPNEQIKWEEFPEVSKKKKLILKYYWPDDESSSGPSELIYDPSDKIDEE